MLFLELSFFLSGLSVNFSQQMMEAFRKLANDENIVREFDLLKPENILKETIDNISKTVELKLGPSAKPPRR